MSEATDLIPHDEQLPVAATTPATLLEMAVAKGADVDQLTKLMELKERYDATEARKAYVAAMSAFRSEAPVLEKNSAVGFGNTSFKFASLDYITGRVNPVLAKHGLSFGWETQQGERIAVTCIVTHELGHSERTALSAAADTSGGKNAIQAIGSAVSYLQRYTLLAVLGLATGGQDTDGNLEPELITAEAAAGIKQQLQETGADVKAFLAMFDIESVDAMPASVYGRAKAALNKKAKEKTNEGA